MDAVPALDIDAAHAGPAAGGRTAAAWEGYQQYSWVTVQRMLAMGVAHNTLENGAVEVHCTEVDVGRKDTGVYRRYGGVHLCKCPCPRTRGLHWTKVVGPWPKTGSEIQSDTLRALLQGDPEMGMRERVSLTHEQWDSCSLTDVLWCPTSHVRVTFPGIDGQKTTACYTLDQANWDFTIRALDMRPEMTNTALPVCQCHEFSASAGGLISRAHAVCHSSVQAVKSLYKSVTLEPRPAVVAVFKSTSQLMVLEVMAREHPCEEERRLPRMADLVAIRDQKRRKGKRGARVFLGSTHVHTGNEAVKRCQAMVDDGATVDVYVCPATLPDILARRACSRHRAMWAGRLQQDSVEELLRIALAADVTPWDGRMETAAATQIMALQAENRFLVAQLAAHGISTFTPTAARAMAQACAPAQSQKRAKTAAEAGPPFDCRQASDDAIGGLSRFLDEQRAPPLLHRTLHNLVSDREVLLARYLFDLMRHHCTSRQNVMAAVHARFPPADGRPPAESVSVQRATRAAMDAAVKPVDYVCGVGLDSLLERIQTTMRSCTAAGPSIGGQIRTAGMRVTVLEAMTHVSIDADMPDAQGGYLYALVRNLLAYAGDQVQLGIHEMCLGVETLSALGRLTPTDEQVRMLYTAGATGGQESTRDRAHRFLAALEVGKEAADLQADCPILTDIKTTEALHDGARLQRVRQATLSAVTAAVAADVTGSQGPVIVVASMMCLEANGTVTMNAAGTGTPPQRTTLARKMDGTPLSHQEFLNFAQVSFEGASEGNLVSWMARFDTLPGAQPVRAGDLAGALCKRARMIDDATSSGDEVPCFRLVLAGCKTDRIAAQLHTIMADFSPTAKSKIAILSFYGQTANDVMALVVLEFVKMQAARGGTHAVTATAKPGSAGASTAEAADASTANAEVRSALAAHANTIVSAHRDRGWVEKTDFDVRPVWCGAAEDIRTVRAELAAVYGSSARNILKP